VKHGRREGRNRERRKRKRKRKRKRRKRRGRGRGIWKELLCNPSVRYSVLRMRLDIRTLAVLPQPCLALPWILVGYGTWG